MGLLKSSLSPVAVALLAAACFSSGVLRAELDDKTAMQVEALNRLKGTDVNANPALKNAVLKVLAKTEGSPQFVELVRDFNLSGQGRPLLKYALEHSGENLGVEAFKLAAKDLRKPEIEKLLHSDDASATARLIGASNDKDLLGLLPPLITDSSIEFKVRKEAIGALAQNQDGARVILDLAKAEKIPPDLKLIASSELNFAPWPEIKKSAAELLPLPQSQNAQPLPPIRVLATKTGNAKHGAEVFASPTVGCMNCHQVNGKGTDFGPNLSEIGTKLGKDALYEAILDPSAGISFGFEGWNIVLKNGDETTGLITSETADEITVKAQSGISTKYKKSEIEKRDKMSLSIMPAGLQLTMSEQDLMDLVEFLSSLKKK
jgi:putative heme-binding domain-containing protein